MEIRFRLDAVVDVKFLEKFSPLVNAGASQGDAFRASLQQLLLEAERGGVILALSSQPPMVNNYATPSTSMGKAVETDSDPFDVDFDDIVIS